MGDLFIYATESAWRHNFARTKVIRTDDLRLVRARSDVSTNREDARVNELWIRMSLVEILDGRYGPFDRIHS